MQKQRHEKTTNWLQCNITVNFYRLAYKNIISVSQGIENFGNIRTTIETSDIKLRNIKK